MNEDIRMKSVDIIKEYLEDRGIDVHIFSLAKFYKIYVKSRKSAYLIIDEYSTSFVKMERENHGEYSILLEL